MQHKVPLQNEPVSLAAELATLSRLQDEALLRMPYNLMIPEEARAYEMRRARIGEIKGALENLRKSA